MTLFEKHIGFFSEEVKRGGVFGKKYRVNVFLYKGKMEGEAFFLTPLSNGHELTPTKYNLSYADITSITLEMIDGRESVVIEYKYNTMNLSGSINRRKIVLWGLANAQQVKEEIQSARQDHLDYLARQDERHRRIREEEQEKERKYEEAALTFYQNCYDFHVKPSTPVYTFQSGKNEVVALYIADDKSMNFMQINGYREEENVGTIPYDNIHYYEKAGNVSYATDIHGNYSSYGGSFTGASFSKGAAALGGLFCGYMGMIAGALYSYKPAQMTPTQTSFKLDSEIVKIDDRNIVLNFYSDEKKQYVDIELPQDIYNFLQTHLPEKKYGIVEAVERQEAVRKTQGTLEAGNGLHLAAAQAHPATVPTQEVDSMAAFKNKVEKLKLMKDAGLLSDEEFDEERKKLLAQL